MRYVEFCRVGREDELLYVHVKTDKDESELRQALAYIRNCGIGFITTDFDEVLKTDRVIRPDELSDLVAPRGD